ncbi:MAG: hypothetical protein AAGU21_13205 [Solidesulfovibrio sp.]|jgi:hypothetical protein|uniref:hypothetical protein n=1 Tax=Solidesulfovibrio sp. TaxID=2910990 RepID=UPI00315904DC
MAAGEKVDILILRDAAGVRRFRVSLLVLRMLWLTPLGLLLLLAAAVAVGHHLRQDNLDLAAQAKAMRGELDAAGQGLITLQNIEKVLRSRDVTELDTLIGSYSAANPGWWKPKAEEGKAEPREREAARPDLARLLARVDANQAGIDNLRARIENKKLLLNFDLSNVTPQTNLVGRVEAALVGNDASLVPLRPEKDELSFQIQRFKQIAASLPLPAKTEARDIYGLKLTILDPAGKTVFAQVYPLPRE